MNYDRMTQLALRGVVRDALRRVIREDGLPGAHHFYITYLTRYPGVDMDEALAKKYPEEITIVIEHQYWDLKAHNDSFEVTLKFGGAPKYLSVPYTAITRFHDPSVGFAIQFDPPEDMQDRPAPPTLARLKLAKGAKPKAVKPAAKKKKTKPADLPSSQASAKPSAKKTTKKQKTPAKTDKKDGGSTVVNLDAFRKK